MKNTKIRELTYIALTLASMMVGGSVVYQISMVLPIPGVKYVFLAPFMAMVIYILLSIIHGKTILMKMGIVFGLIMSMMNLFMGISIILTAFLSQLAMSMAHEERKAFVGSVAFTFFTGVIALTISKVFIGGIFMSLPNAWILVTGLLCALFGVVGTVLAKRLLKYFQMNSYNM